jgi:hypothetical protein
MNTFRVTVMLVVLGGAYWLHQMSDPNRQPVNPLIPKLVNQMLDQKSNVCVEAGPFPYDTASPPTEWNAHIGNYATCEPIRCNRCEDLVQAGLLNKSTGTMLDESGLEKTTVRYELTTDGVLLYHHDINNYDALGSGQPVCRPGERMTGKTPENEYRPGLCFAKRKVFHAVVDRLKPINFGGNKAMSFKYVAAAVEPEPFLFDPRAKALLPSVPGKPENGQPALYPPVLTSLVVYPGGQDGDLDGGLRYGKWVNEK